MSEGFATLIWSDYLGFVGVAMLIGAYAALQTGKIQATNPLYSLLNLGASILIGISLIYNFNAASFIIEVFWFIISLVGLIRSLKKNQAD